MFSAGGKSAVTSGYNINNSLRFRRSASAHLSRTTSFSGTTNTISFWLKRGELGTRQVIFGWSDNTSNALYLQFDTSNRLEIYNLTAGSLNLNLVTTQVFRDPSAWYHFVVVLNTTQATASNRVQFYVNGSQITAFDTATYPAQNTSLQSGNSRLWNIGREGNTGNNPGDFYLAEWNFLDSQALTPSSFGETNATTGVWKPKAYSGTYGTNGFYQKYSDIATTSSSNAGLGKDFSGNGNFWTTNNISVTADATYDAMTDSPTLTSTRESNYATINPLYVTGSTETPIINANLTADNNGGVSSGCVCSIPLDGGKWYWEVTITTAGATMQIGVIPTGKIDSLGKSTTGIFAYHSNGDKFVNGVQSAYGASYTTNDVIGMTYDSSTGVLTAYKNNVSQGTLTTLTATTSYIPYLGFDNGTAQRVSINFGQQPFVYTPPTGFNRLNTFNLPDSTIKKGNRYVEATTYRGTNTSLSVTNAGSFRPDFVWIKSRDASSSHAVYDSVRGTTNDLATNSAANTTIQAQGLTAFNSDGFTIGTLAKVNGANGDFVAWQWQAGEGTTASNANGTIPSTVSVNATAGFSIVTYSGTGVNATVGHGLGVAPAMIIVKCRNFSGDWQVRHKSIAAGNTILLNSDLGEAAATSVWNSTLPTSTVFSIGNNSDVNSSLGTYVAYCWAEIAGFSKFGSYTGNGSADGPFVYLGFRPKIVIVKSSITGASGTSWRIGDTSRNLFNLNDKDLHPNDNNVEGSDFDIDVVSTGFKIRATSTPYNNNATTIYYAAFAENPFKNALAR